MRIRNASGSVRLAVGGFCVLILGFGLLAQANLWVQDGGGRPPAPEAVLWKYHGKPHNSRLHTMLDPDQDPLSPLNMAQYLGLETEVPALRKQILDWVDGGAPFEGWADVSPIFTDPVRCGQCHAPGGQKQDVPFTTYEEVYPYTRPDTGMRKEALLISAHNHLFAFAVSSLLLGLLLCHASRPSRWRVLLLLAAFLGPALDVGGWFLTHFFGAPFHWVVLAGGALFGGASALMALWILADCLRLGRGTPADAAG